MITAIFRRFDFNTLPTVLVILATSVRAHAAPLASEDFSTYSSSPATNIAGLNDGTGWGSSWSVGAIVEGYLNEVRSFEGGGAANLSYPGYVANGGNYANLAAGFGGPTFNYIQRTIDREGTFASYGAINAQGYEVAGADGTTLWGSFLYHNVAGLQVWFQQQTGPEQTTNQMFTVPTTGSNSLYIFRIDFGPGNADTITIWDNPNLATWNPAALPTATANADYSFANFILVTPADQNEARLDNIRFGSEAIDVVPYSSTPSTPYQLWAVSKGLDPFSPEGAPGGDRDQDGAENLEEYAFSTDPQSGSSLPVFSEAVDATNLTVTYLRANAATDVVFAAEVSTELATWTGTGITDLPTGTSNTEAVEYRITAPLGTDPKKFVRINVSLTPTP